MQSNLRSLVFLAAFSVLPVAQADQFAFDPNGTGSTAISNAALIDQAPGSAIAVGGTTAIGNFLAGSGSTKFTLYYQANLTAVQDENTANLFTNGSGGHFFTFVAGVGENVIGIDNSGTASFAFDPSNPVNFFTMYATTTIGNNLTGAGFVSSKPILTGHITTITSSNFTVSSTNAVNFDQSPNGNQWGTQQSVTGSGSSDLALVIDSVDPNYFPLLQPMNSSILSFINSSQVTPFRQVDPSKCFNTGSAAANTCTGGGLTSTGTLGAVNGASGSGPNFEFQADANQAIMVPEPGAVTLFAVGLALVGFRAARRRAS